MQSDPRARAGSDSAITRAGHPRPPIRRVRSDVGQLSLRCGTTALRQPPVDAPGQDDGDHFDPDGREPCADAGVERSRITHAGRIGRVAGEGQQPVPGESGPPVSANAATAHRPDLAQLDAEKTRQRTIDLGMPTFSDLAGRTGSSPQPGFSPR